MDKHLKKKIKFIFIVFLILVYVLPSYFSFFSIVYGKEPKDVGYNEWNDVPSDCGDVFSYMGWQLITDKTSDDWKLIEKAGRNYDDEGYGIVDGCYVIACTWQKQDGIGLIGDYIDFQLDDGTIISCIMGDVKGRGNPKEPVTVWGHNDGRCVVEFIVDCNTWYEPGWPSYKKGKHTNPGQGNGKLDKILHGRKVVKYIRKGNYIDGDKLGNNNGNSSGSGGGVDFTDFWGIVKGIFGGIWDAICVEFENLNLERNDTTVMYDLNDKDDNGGTSGSGMGGNVIEVCEKMAQYLVSKDAHYGAKQWVDIETSYNNPDGDVVCATYVSLVLWKSGMIPKEIINRHNFHYTGDFKAMLTDAGYHQVSASEAQPGDVALNNPGPKGHVLIYAGEGRYFWDESCGVWTKSRGQPNGKVRDTSYYYTHPLTTFWHKD